MLLKSKLGTGMSAAHTKTIMELILSRFEELTRAERQLANTLMEEYPLSALGSITQLAENASVSSPTVARMVYKLGFSGFPQFQQALRSELSAKISSPIDKHEQWARSAPDTHILNQFTEKVSHNIRRTLAQTNPQTFDQVVRLLTDESSHVYLAGGRITASLANYFFTHLQMIRPGVTDMHSAISAWPHYIIDMNPNDVLVIFDIRRYENDLLRLAKIALRQELTIVLVTDQWSSPVSKHARYKFNCHIEVPSAWDSTIVIMLLLEALIAAIQNSNWPETKKRMKSLEALFDQTRLFRKPN